MAIEQTIPLFEGEHEDLIEEAKDVMGEEFAEYWLNTGNSRFGGEKPIDFVRSDDPWRRGWVRDVLRSIKYVGIS